MAPVRGHTGAGVPKIGHSCGFFCHACEEGERERESCDMGGGVRGGGMGPLRIKTQWVGDERRGGGGLPTLQGGGGRI